LKHGRVGHSVFQPEIGISNVNSPHLKQKTVNLKFLTDVKQSSFAMNYAATIEDAQKINEEDSIIVIGKTIEWATFYGDSDLSSGEKGEGLQFDGLAKLIDESNHLDLRGGSLTPEVLNKAATLIGEGFGYATDAYMPIGVKADFGNQFLGSQRVIVPSSEGTTAGVDVDHFLSARGNIRLNGSTIMDADDRLDMDQVPDAQAPGAPVVTAEEVKSAGGRFQDELKDSDGVVYSPAEIGSALNYRVTAVGHHGDSYSSDVATATPTSADSGIKLTIKLDAMQREIPDYLAIYRQSLVQDGTKEPEFYLVGTVATREMQEDGSFTFTDLNGRIPGTADVFVGEMKRNVIALMEFMPLSKVNLAVVTTAVSFAVTTSVALALYLPKRWVMIHNVRYNNAIENHMAGVNLRAYVGNK